MGWTCSTYGGTEKGSLYRILLEYLKEINHLEELGLDLDIFKKQGGSVDRIYLPEHMGHWRALVNRQCTFGSLKMRINS
jgi:hypothetical protein